MSKEIWEAVSKDDLEEVISFLEESNSKSHEVVRSALLQVLIEKWKESPEEKMLVFKCPQCGIYTGGRMVNNGEKIYTEAVKCSCGWFRGPRDVSMLELLERDKEN